MNELIKHNGVATSTLISFMIEGKCDIGVF